MRSHKCECDPVCEWCVLFAECKARVTDEQRTCARVENPSDCEVCFCDAQGDVLAACVVGIRQEGVNPCRMVPSMKGRGTVQLHDVTGKVQRAQLRIAAQKREVRVAALVLRV